MQITHAWPGVVKITFPYNPQLIELLKHKNGERYPASHFSKEEKAWYVDVKLAEEQFGFVSHQLAELNNSKFVTLLEHQFQALCRLYAERVLICQWNVGMGKSRVAVEVAQNVKHTLIVCPAMMLEEWPGKFTEWDYTAPFICKNTTKIPDEQPKVVVISYGSVHKLPTTWQYKFLCFDEIHYAMNEGSNRSELLLNIVKANPRAIRLGLTATPECAELYNIHNQISLLCPHRFGTFNQWVSYYHVTDLEGYNGARRIHGIKPERLQEYKERLDTICHIADQSRVAHRFPETRWQIKWLPKSSRPIGEKELGRWSKIQGELSAERVEKVLAEVEQAAPACFVTYLTSTAELLAAQLGAPLITGKLTPKKRREILSVASVVVCSMKSIEVGIDLRRFTNVYIVESFPVPSTMEQMLGRFVRLGGKETINFTFLPMKGTADEIVIPRLVKRLEAQNKLRKAGAVKNGLLDILKQRESDELLQAEMQAALLAGFEVEEEE
jgi:superfamily II DNA or RNA helicase